jgi:hypothetical protein
MWADANWATSSSENENSAGVSAAVRVCNQQRPAGTRSTKRQRNGGDYQATTPDTRAPALTVEDHHTGARKRIFDADVREALVEALERQLALHVDHDDQVVDAPSDGLLEREIARDEAAKGEGRG